MNARQLRTIEALLTEPTQQAAADTAGVPVRSVQRWLKDAEFKAALRGAARDRLHAAVSRLKETSGEAVSVLRGLLKAESETVRLRAALGALDVATRCELAELDERLSALEGAVKEGKNA